MIDGAEGRNCPNPWIHEQAVSTDESAQKEAQSGEINFPVVDIPPINMDMNREMHRWRNRNRCAISYPISKYEWGIDGDLGSEVVECRLEAHGGSEQLARDVVQAGNILAQNSGSFDRAM